MTQPTISLIAAMSQNRVIGRNGQLPWRLPADLQHFKQLTTGHTLIMGRKTFESVGKALPNRTNLVLSRQPNYSAANIEVFTTLADALAAVNPDEVEVFVVGGGEIYAQALPLADRIYLTVVHQSFEGDAFFPDFSHEPLMETSRRDFFEGDLPFSIVQYDRQLNS